MNIKPRLIVVLFSLALAPLCALSQQGRQYSDADYANAEKLMAYNVNPLAYKGQVSAQWLDDERFWYREVDDSGISYIAGDPAKGSRAPLFDQEKLAAALKSASKTGFDPKHLQLSDISLSNRDRTLTFTSHSATYQCNTNGVYSCKVITGGAPAKGESPHPPLTLSPDNKLGAFIRDWNLWIRYLESGAETQLSRVGFEYFG